MFGDERRKKMNLGGVSSVTTHATILADAQARREERINAKRRQDSATMIQSWWRSSREAQVVRRQLRDAFDRGADSVVWTRYLVFGGVSEDRLGRWSTVMSQNNFAALIQPFTTAERESWLVLVRRVSIILLRSISTAPESPNARTHLLILNTLMSPVDMQKILPDGGNVVYHAITNYLCSRDFVRFVAAAFTRIPVESRKSPSLPPLAVLCTRPFASIGPQTPNLQAQFLQHIMTLPLLPNRIPIASLGLFSAGIPLSSLEHLGDSAAVVSSLNNAARTHLLANLATFMPQMRYEQLEQTNLRAYLALLNQVVASTPPSSLEIPPQQSAIVSIVGDSDDEFGDIREVNATVAGSLLRLIDSKTAARINGLLAPAHLSILLKLAGKAPIAYALLANISAVWPNSRASVLRSAVAHGGSNLVKALWRDWVRGSSIGRDVDMRLLTDPSHADQWPPLVFLLQVYAQMLLTMGDEEFFSAPGAPRNPLSLAEVTELVYRALRVAFVLYWNEDQADVKDGRVPGLAIRWEMVRSDATTFLQSVHARDSRRPFVPPQHWLLTSQIDVSSFVEAAVIEDTELTTPEELVSRGPRHTMSKRQVAFMSPRLGVLHNIPFALPFEVRVAIFRAFVLNDQRRLGIDMHHPGARHRIVIRRNRIAEDGFDHLNEMGANLKGSLAITFVDQFGQEEAGIDGGGVFKEFLTALSKEVFNADRGLWLETSQHELYPNPMSMATEPHQLNWYRFVGRILGKALYQGILVEVAFASFFLAKWLSKQSFLDDLASLDQELYKGLIYLKHYQGNPEDLALNFTINEDDLGVTRTINLIPNGENIPVTRENKLQYIHLVCHHRLSRQIQKQSRAFFEGLSEIIDPKWLRMFNQQELQILVAGVNTDVDVDDLRQNTNYGGVYDADEETIVAFWGVVKSFDTTQRRQLLRFVTSCSRPPLLGFKELVPLFSIRDAGNDQTRLPTSSTCVNLLKLPRYKSEAVLKQKLLQAIQSNSGFDLS
ncbi:HECT-domain-containing protein [Auriculariales sp. MPI-PUGE-AT-0066]|nr:HECT-domain-containing protein [Auriculariales sp. MPI-PUGE-AT-0066]